MSLGIYIHIPFCQAKCNYCHFVTAPYHTENTERYKRSVITEIEIFPASSPANEDVNSIYFGGGTPSLLPPDHISEILAACRRKFSVSVGCEVSLESNPGTISSDKTMAYRNSGLNRISIGAQSFEDKELALIGRLHTSDMIKESLHRLRESGFINLNLDLMLGLPLQTSESWKRNLEKTVALGVPHVSVYMLDLDDQCALYACVERGLISIPEEDFLADLYLETIEFLSANGYQQYEISNFALPGFACRHNLKYWTREPVLGYGLSSHSFDGHTRYANYQLMEDYLQAIETRKAPIDWRKPLDEAQALEETLFLGLRLNEGVNWKRLQSLYDRNSLAKHENSLRRLSDEGFVEWKDSIVRLTPRGMLLSNEIFQLFL